MEYYIYRHMFVKFGCGLAEIVCISQFDWYLYSMGEISSHKKRKCRCVHWYSIRKIGFYSLCTSLISSMIVAVASGWELSNISTEADISTEKKCARADCSLEGKQNSRKWWKAFWEGRMHLWSILFMSISRRQTYSRSVGNCLNPETLRITEYVCVMRHLPVEFNTYSTCF